MRIESNRIQNLMPTTTGIAKSLTITALVLGILAVTTAAYDLEGHQACMKNCFQLYKVPEDGCEPCIEHCASLFPNPRNAADHPSLMIGLCQDRVDLFI